MDGVMSSRTVEPVLVTAQTLPALAEEIARAVSVAPLIGLDIETDQPRAHAGIQAVKRLVFDTRRTDLCGLSLWPQGHSRAFYFNLGHADQAERVAWAQVENLLAWKGTHARWVVHNATFERTMLLNTVGYTLKDYICTLQMAVSAYGPDQYDMETFRTRDLGGIAALVPRIVSAARAGLESEEMQELLAKITAKESDASHSWNGYVNEMSYGYGLKKAVRSWFGHDMMTFEQALQGRKGMSDLTGAEALAYACEDAVWCCRLYDALLAFMLESNPAVVHTYFTQELPMVEVYSEVWRDGIRINGAAVRAKRDDLRLQYAGTVRRLKAALGKLFPFPRDPHPALLEHEEWYRRNWETHRARLEEWVSLPDSDDPYTQAAQVSGAIPNNWQAERGVKPRVKPLNLTHYMVTRLIIYDLFQREKLILEQGKVQSDGDTRGRIKAAVEKKGLTTHIEVLTALGELATIEQADKLYLTPYLNLVDPETSRIHPVMSSMLATRRMATQNPNPMQLAKRGETVYVRGFYEPDYADHVIVSLDWSQIELVLLGEFSGDKEFARCYSVVPYEDVHKIATAACLGVSDEELARLKRHDPDVSPHLLLNPRGEPLPIERAYKYWRTEVGKGSNFEWAYSGLLSNVATRLGWDRDKMFEVTQAYETRFAGAAAWRRSLLEEVQRTGRITLPDGHQRVRVEAMAVWAALFRAKWQRYNHLPGIEGVVTKLIRRLQTRAGNMAVNAMIQGSSATLTKRSVLRLRERLGALGWGKREARFMVSIHDEVVYSVQRSLVVEFITLAREVMRDHPDIIQNLRIDCTPSVGLTFQPWEATKAPFGQIELYEAPELDFIPSELHGERLPEEYWPRVVDHLFAERARCT